jgi:hypothetical protein
MHPSLSALLAIGGFVLLLTLLVVVRTRWAARFEVKTSDIALCLVPVGLWLLLTGRVREFGYGDFKISGAIREAAAAPVEGQLTRVTGLPVEQIVVGSKGSPGGIPTLVANQSGALSFQLGHGEYHGGAIRYYLDQLTRYPFLRYVLITNADGSFVGMADARQLEALVSTPGGPVDADTLAAWINGSARARLEALPGFVPAAHALRRTTDKRTALQAMDAHHAETLPVLDEAGRFLGVVSRSQLTASLLVEIAAKVEAAR